MIGMEKFARCCGYAVYAVAYADKSIEQEERAAIHLFLNENWMELADNSDPFGVKSIEFIEQMMDALVSDKLNSELAFERFKDQFDSLNNTLSGNQQKFILNLCIKVGNAFNRMNKSELVLLSRIERIIHPRG
jgi:hypothetical protein